MALAEAPLRPTARPIEQIIAYDHPRLYERYASRTMAGPCLMRATAL